MPLTDTAIRSLKPAAKARKVADERGLYLEISPAGGRWWRFKFYSPITRKEKRLSLGVYPDVSLKEARDRRDEAKKLIANGIDPGEQRKSEHRATAAKAVNTFEAVMREWYEKHESHWAESHSKRLMRLFERDVFPFRGLGSRPISDIQPAEILDMLRPIEGRAPETAHRALQNCSQVFRYGIASGKCPSDPTRVLRGALSPVTKGHFAATTEPKRLGAILHALDGYQGTLVVSSALRLAPLVFVRPGELRKARWKDFDLETAEWRYFVTKTKTDHIVPLSRQAVAILRSVHDLTGTGDLVFPSARGNKRPMSDNAILVAMRTLEIRREEMTGHGFRAVARTLLDEVLGFRPDIIEQQLAHTVSDPLGRAYNRTKFLKERSKMMQIWADHLDSLKSGDIAQVIRLPISA